MNPFRQNGLRRSRPAANLYRMLTHRTAVMTLLMGTAAAGAIACAPLAIADDPPPCAPEDQQCQQQPPDPVAIVGSATDQANQALNQAPAASPYPTTGPPGGVCARMNGFPIYIPPGGIPSEMASGVPSGPVHAGPCTAKDTFVGVDQAQRGLDAAAQIQGAATPPQQPEQRQPPPPGQ